MLFVVVSVVFFVFVAVLCLFLLCFLCGMTGGCFFMFSWAWDRRKSAKTGQENRPFFGKKDTQAARPSNLLPRESLRSESLCQERTCEKSNCKPQQLLLEVRRGNGYNLSALTNPSHTVLLGIWVFLCWLTGFHPFRLKPSKAGWNEGGSHRAITLLDGTNQCTGE